MQCEITVDKEMVMIRRYSELIKLETFEERFEYLKLNKRIGEETFGFDRYLNQYFYKSDEWKSIRNFILIRDSGCDLAMSDREIKRKSLIIVHHINPITKSDLILKNDCLLDPENLICTLKSTHEAIHYGNEDLLIREPIIRTRNDTCPWKNTTR